MVLPQSQQRFQKPGVLIFFIFPRERLSEKTLLLSKVISLTFAFGPSSMVKVTCSPDPPMFFASCLTVPKSRPFSASISLMIFSTLRALVGS